MAGIIVGDFSDENGIQAQNGDVLIDRNTYVMCKTLLSLDSLRTKGLVDGGCEIDRPKMLAITTACEALGCHEPIAEEINSVMQYLASPDFVSDLEEEI